MEKERKGAEEPGQMLCNYDMGPQVATFTSSTNNHEALCRQLAISQAHLLVLHPEQQAKAVVQIDKAFLTLGSATREKILRDACALMTNLPGLYIGVSTARGIPLLIYDQQHQAVCAICAEKPRTVEQMACEALNAMGQAYGSTPANLMIQIGQQPQAVPSITAIMRRHTDATEWHPLVPFLPSHARVLFLGSFPPQLKRWSMDFFYPNFINDHWRIEGQLFYDDPNHFVLPKQKAFDRKAIVEFCQQKGIAFFDTAIAVRRLKDNAADEFLEVVEPTDIGLLLAQLPHCRAIVTTGQKATDTLCRNFALEHPPKVGSAVPIKGLTNSEGDQVKLFRLPSSSRAYPLAFEKKVAAYRAMFTEVGL